MALVVLLRGVNVGGHRRFRPAEVVRQLGHLDAVNVGAAGTIVVRRAIGRRALRSEIARRLPFDTEIVICDGRDVVRLLAVDHFAGYPPRHDVVRFVSTLARAPRMTPGLPLRVPERGQWWVRVLGREGRFVVGVYRRHMKAIGQLGALDRLFGVPVTTRGWNTFTAIGAVLGAAD